MQALRYEQFSCLKQPKQCPPISMHTLIVNLIDNTHNAHRQKGKRWLANCLYVLANREFLGILSNQATKALSLVHYRATTDDYNFLLGVPI